MKIWVQSGSALAANATPGYEYGQRYEKSLQDHFRRVARPGTIVEAHGISSSPAGKDRYYASQHVVLTLMIESLLRAPAEGFDVIAISNTIDPGLREIREIVDLPVVFISESAMHTACMLGSKFGFLAHNEAMLTRMEEIADRYGLSSRMAAGAVLNLSYADFPKMYQDPQAYIARIVFEAEHVVRRGAEVLVAVGNAVNMFLVDQGVKDIAGVPFLDACGAMIKTSELMVDLRNLGIADARRCAAGRPSQEDAAAIRKLYGSK